MELITLELRPRLQCCNAFIAVRKDLCLKNVRIKLRESNIILILGEDCRINLLLPRVKVIPTSLSMLNVINNWICFRLQTAPLESVFGSFSTEVVTDTNTSVQSSNSPLAFLDNIKLLFKTSECVILCTCCKNVLSKSINFKRFLSLPDLECDPNEWFCCKHSVNVVTNMQSQESDYFYGSCFSVLHKNIFENVHVDNKALTCNKCLLHVGTLHADSLFKIWNCCVDYKAQNSALNTVAATDPLNDFLILIKESLSEILGEEIILQTFVGKQIHCLLIKPMDCKLNLITEPNNKVMNNSDTISLQQKCVAKVLYKYGSSKISTTTNYSNIKHLEVGLPIIEAGLNYLLSSTKRLPHAYRTVTVATDCFLGYIVLQEIVN